MIGATLFSELPAAVRVRDEPRYEHPRWRVGDRVRPRHEWSDGQTPVIPSGEVVRAERVASGLPAPEDFRAMEAAPAVAPVAAPAEPAPASASPAAALPPRWPVYLWGLTHGALLALWLRWWWS